jgi:uncharacterized protein YjbI with pentapeptide repeats
MGTRPDVRIHRHGVHIKGACIDEPIELTNAQIPYEVSFERCRFNKVLTFDHANFTGGLSLLGSRFKEASFNHMKVGGDAVFQQAEFEAGRPISVIIADDLKPAKPKIRKVQRAAQFTGMKVAGDAIFFSAVFDGVVFFPRIDVGGDFRGDQTKFNEVAFFTRMKIGGDAFFSGATFKGLPYFFEADIAGKFNAPGAKFQNEELAAVFHNMKVRGDTDFNGAKFDGPLDLRYADFGLINLPRDSWPKLPAKVHMQGMRYKQISAAKDEPDSFEALLKLAGQSVYSADVYGNLEEFFLRQGHQWHADRAFIERKRRERKENLHGLPWLGSWLLDWLVGYGRRPEQAGWFCLAIIGIGSVLFPLKKMELQDPEERTKPEEDRPRYNRFWYSLGLFLPVVNLKTSEVWGPKKQCRFLRNYLRVHILLGWILVPIFLAAITGLLR